MLLSLLLLLGVSISVNLRELFYDRNPGDARVKVGSERKVVSSPPAPPAPSSGVAEIGRFVWPKCAEGPSKIGLLLGIFIPKKALSVREIWRSKWQSCR